MRRVILPRTGTAAAWREAARGLLAAGIPPEAVSWGGAEAAPGLFETDAQPLRPVRPVRRDAITVPRGFVVLSDTVVWHSDPARFDRLYAFLWRLRDAPWLISDRGDADLARLRAMEKAVRRCQHKMKAFVRFREIGDPSAARRSFAAWFEPTHHTVEPTADFFTGRFADMDWRILSPDVSAIYEKGALRFEEDLPRPDLPEDASEALWVTYFRNIFNPARLKVQAMQSEMPRKYWKNLPEAAAIPDLVASAPARAREMVAAAPTLPPLRAARAQAQVGAHRSAWRGDAAGLDAEIRACTRCPLHCNATQAVPGEGPRPAPLMIVGGQPDDREDLCGRPFVGPAGQLFDTLARDSGLDRGAAYVTNAVKHFKFRPQGRRRIHQRPDAGEVRQCKWWLDAERDLVRPQVTLALGATAALALTGSGADMATRRGRIEQDREGRAVLVTFHPAYLLRLPGAAERARAADLLRADLGRAVGLLQS